MAKPATKSATKTTKAATPDAEPEATAHTATIVTLRATASDASDTSELPDAPKTTAHSLSRAEIDLVVAHAPQILAQAATIEATKKVDVAKMIADAKATQAKLDRLDRLQGSFEAARADVQGETAAIDAFAALVDGVAGSASATSTVGKALQAFHRSRAAVRGVAKGVKARRATIAAKGKTSTPKP